MGVNESSDSHLLNCVCTHMCLLACLCVCLLIGMDKSVMFALSAKAPASLGLSAAPSANGKISFGRRGNLRELINLQSGLCVH